MTDGKSTAAILGGRGRTVAGKLVGLDSWEGTAIELDPSMPKGPGDHDWLARALVYQSSFGPLLFRTRIPVAEDGTFRIENVLPGEYNVRVRNRERPSYAWQNSGFTIDPMPGDESDEPLDMGEVRVKRY